MSTKFMTNMFIDTIQNAKHEWIKTWIKTDSIAKPMTEFVNAQTQFAKAVVETSEDVANATAEAMTVSK